MRHFIQYGNSEDRWVKEPYIYTKKKVNCQAGDRVWLLGKRLSKNGSKYFLVKNFIFTHIDDQPEWIYYRGDNLIFKDDLIEIGIMPWFNEFFEKIGRGAFGFSPLPQEFIKRIEDAFKS